MRRPLTILAACYITARVLLAVDTGPTYAIDTRSYWGISLTGGAIRPWVVPLLMRVCGDHLFVILQAALSGAAFIALAVALAATMRSAIVRLGIMAVVLLIGFNPRIVRWDAMLLSDSLAITLTVLLLAALAHLRWAIDRHPVALVALMVIWVFTRDAHAYLAIPVAVGIGLVAWRSRRAVTIALAVVVAWGLAAGANDDTIEGFNVATHMAYTFDDDPAAIGWFRGHGMPDSPGLHLTEPSPRLEALEDDPTFMEWAKNDGARTYIHYAVTHPRFLIQPLGSLVDYYPPHGIMLDAPTTTTNTPATDVIWPTHARDYTIALLTMAGIVAWRAGWDRRYGVPLLLIGSTIPHALLIWHGSGLELLRHALVLQVVVTVSGWWLLAVAGDRYLWQSSPAGHVGEEETGRTMSVVGWSSAPRDMTPI